jgi:hypothetical protein
MPEQASLLCQAFADGTLVTAGDWIGAPGGVRKAHRRPAIGAPANWHRHDATQAAPRHSRGQAWRGTDGEHSAAVRERVEQARLPQRRRFGLDGDGQQTARSTSHGPRLITNADIGPGRSLRSRRGVRALPGGRCRQGAAAIPGRKPAASGARVRPWDSTSPASWPRRTADASGWRVRWGRVPPSRFRCPALPGVSWCQGSPTCLTVLVGMPPPEVRCAQSGQASQEHNPVADRCKGVLPLRIEPRRGPGQVFAPADHRHQVG